MKPKVYLETTIPSYLTAKPTRDLVLVAHQQITIEWWFDHRRRFNIFISRLVREECSRGDHDAAERRLAVVRLIPEIALDDRVQILAEALVAEGAIPRKAQADSVHIAVSAVHKMNYLLTWNCTHINNAETREAVSRICKSHGHVCPVICTPEELMGGIET